MLLVGSGLISEQVSLMRPINIEIMHFGTETSGLNSEGGLNNDKSLLRNFTVI